MGVIPAGIFSYKKFLNNTYVDISLKCIKTSLETYAYIYVHMFVESKVASLAVDNLK